MAKNSKITGFLLAASFSTSAFLPANIAFAQTSPENIEIQLGCRPAATVQAELSAAGQNPIVVGNRITTRVDRPGNIFTANTRGEGYMLEGDQPIGAKSTMVCVKAHYVGLHLNNINSPEVPEWALIGNDKDEANNNCRATQSGLCESHDDYVRRATAGGMRVMLSARTVFKNDDGSQRDGRLVTVLTQVATKLADVKATNSVGASESIAGLESVNYTQYATAMLPQQNTTLASYTPK